MRKTLTTEWVEFATLIDTTVSTDDKYRIYNVGNDVALLAEGSAAPTEVDGEPLLMDKRVTFTKPESSTLYLRASNGSTVLNIVKVS